MHTALLPAALLPLLLLLALAMPPEPYMDEEFHERQTMAYCRGEWHVWDSMITTLPGLYLLATALRMCSLSAMRCLNAVLAALGVVLLQAMVRADADRRSRRRGLLVRLLQIVLLPTHLFYAPFYYTDTLAVVLVLLLFHLVTSPRAAPSLAARLLRASVAVAAVLARQTNVVWVAFVVAIASVRELRLDAQERRGKHWARSLSDDAWLVVRNMPRLVVLHAELVLVMLAFVVFVVVNGGLVVGAREDHSMTLHLPQLGYLALTLLIVAWPSVLARAVDLLQSGRWRQRISLPFLVLALAAAAAAVAQFTMVHRYLLADNRHYSFYIWSKIINVHPLARYALVPVYVGVFALANDGLWEQPPITRLILLLTSAVVLVPSPLLEFRYYTLPIIFYMLLRQPVEQRKRAAGTVHVGEWITVVYQALLLALLWLVFLHPLHSAGIRFMW